MRCETGERFVVNCELVESQERIEVGCDQRSIVKMKG